jgi:hypothetical protein
MSDQTHRFGLPFILPGQAQKEFFHNEALAAADFLLHACVEQGPSAEPPAEAQPGQTWLVAGGALGAWAEHEQSLASWTEGGWRFAAPVDGMHVWNKSEALFLHWNGTAWVTGELRGSRIVIAGEQVVGERQPAVPSPSGGTIIDAEARAAVAGLIVALKSHGLID